MSMKSVALLGVAAFCTSAALANYTFSFSPYDADLQDLPHEYAYAWGINWDMPEGEAIASVTITFEDIYNWTNEPNQLHVSLLDAAELGVDRDYDNTAGNYYTGDNVFVLGVWEDPNGNAASAIDLSYDVPADHFAWISDGNFGFGIDPDCHFYNNGISVEINTIHTPVPGTGLLTIVGFGIASWVKRRRHA